MCSTHGLSSAADCRSVGLSMFFSSGNYRSPSVYDQFTFMLVVLEFDCHFESGGRLHLSAYSILNRCVKQGLLPLVNKMPH
jgi:hypothetical protein